MEKTESSNKTNWKLLVIPIVVTAVFSLIVGVAAPMIVDYINTPQLKLQYYSQDTVPFKTSEIQIASYQIVIINDGSKALDNIICQISLTDATINQHTFSPSAPYTYSQENATNKVIVKINNLNPKESGTIYLLATSEKQLPAQPNIQLRADGITGEKAVSTTSTTFSSMFDTAFMVMIVSLMGLMMGLLSFRGVFRFSSKYKNQKECLGYLCGNQELYSEMERYYNTDEIFFRNEADRLTCMAIKNPADRKKVQAVLLNLLEYTDHLSSESRGIIHFNLAKLAKLEGNLNEQKQHLESAKKCAAKAVEARLKIDGVLKS